MWSALVGASIPVAIGVGVALTPWFRRELLRPARFVAVTAVLAVVCLELLPRAWDAGGATVIAVFLAALMGPVALERATARLRVGHDLTVELAFAVLLFHQLVDGFEIGAAHRSGSAPWAVTAAIAAHSVPFVAAIVLGFASRRGPKEAGLRGLALIVATAVGTLVGTALLGRIEEAAPWLPALVGGLMLHVAWHDLGPDHDHDHDHAHDDGPMR